MVQWYYGACAVTRAEERGCPNAAEQGAFGLEPSTVAGGWHAASLACHARCAACSSCFFFTVSLRHSDCSWYGEFSCTPSDPDFGGARRSDFFPSARDFRTFSMRDVAAVAGRDAAAGPANRSARSVTDAIAGAIARAGPAQAGPPCFGREPATGASAHHGVVFCDRHLDVRFERGLGTALPNGSVVEVLHTSTESRGAQHKGRRSRRWEQPESVVFGARWLYRLSGSGVFFSLGRTLAFTEHYEFNQAFGVRCPPPVLSGPCRHVSRHAVRAARRAGWDSVQFTRHTQDLADGGEPKFELVDLQPMAPAPAGTRFQRYCADSRCNRPCVASWYDGRVLQCAT